MQRVGAHDNFSIWFFFTFDSVVHLTIYLNSFVHLSHPFWEHRGMEESLNEEGADRVEM